MRFTVLAALLVGILAACCSSYAMAEDNTIGRRLNGKKVAETATQFVSGQVDDVLLKKAAKVVTAAKGDEAAMKKALDLASLAKASAKLTDDEVAKVTAMVKEARGDEAHTMRYILGFSQKEGKALSDKSTALVSAKIADTVKKNPKSWPRLRQFAKITLGVSVGLAAYGAYKMAFDKKAPADSTTSTTTG